CRSSERPASGPSHSVLAGPLRHLGFRLSSGECEQVAALGLAPFEHAGPFHFDAGAECFAEFGGPVLSELGFQFGAVGSQGGGDACAFCCHISYEAAVFSLENRKSTRLNSSHVKI